MNSNEWWRLQVIINRENRDSRCMTVEIIAHIEVAAFDSYEKILVQHVFVSFMMDLFVGKKKVDGAEEAALIEERLRMHAGVLVNSIGVEAAEGTERVVVDLIADLTREI
jgi:hypothetical protein